MFRDDEIRACLALGYKSGRMLFELRPDICPEGYVTRLELELWGLYYESLNA